MINKLVVIIVGFNGLIVNEKSFCWLCRPVSPMSKQLNYKHY